MAEQVTLGVREPMSLLNKVTFSFSARFVTRSQG